MFSLDFEKLFAGQMTTTFLQTFMQWFLAYLTLFIPVRNLNERFMGAVTALLVLASLLGTMENTLPKSSQMKFIDFWFLWYIINIFFIIIFHVVLENLNKKEKKIANKTISSILPILVLVFNIAYFSLSVMQLS